MNFPCHKEFVWLLYYLFFRSHFDFWKWFRRYVFMLISRRGGISLYLFSLYYASWLLRNYYAYYATITLFSFGLSFFTVCAPSSHPKMRFPLSTLQRRRISSPMCLTAGGLIFHNIWGLIRDVRILCPSLQHCFTRLLPILMPCTFRDSNCKYTVTGLRRSIG